MWYLGVGEEGFRKRHDYVSMICDQIGSTVEYPLGVLGDRVGRLPMIIGGWFLYAAVYFGFAFADKAGVWWLFSLYGLFMGLTDGIGRALIRDKIQEEKKGTAMGIVQMSLGFMALAGSVVAGLLWDIVGPQAPFILGATVPLAAVVCALLLVPGRVLESKNT